MVDTLASTPTHTFLPFSTRSLAQILVGHSHFFRNLVRHHLSPALRHTQPLWAAELSKFTMENGACMRVKVKWDPASIAGKTAAISPLIVEVRMRTTVKIRVKTEWGLGTR